MTIDNRGRAAVAGLATLTALLALLAIGGAGCGGGTSMSMPPINDADAGPPTITTGPYQPLTIGSTWTYHVEDQGVVYDKQSSVEAFEDMMGMAPGVMGYKVRETIKSTIQMTWYEQTQTDVRRHHDVMTDDQNRMLSDEWYTPYLLRVDESPEHLQAGAAWSINYTHTKVTSSKPMTETNKTENWTVDGVDVVTKVTAGTFQALKIIRADPTDGSTKTQWFVRGVGKVRELTSAGHYEDLTNFNVVPAPAQ